MKASYGFSVFTAAIALLFVSLKANSQPAKAEACIAEMMQQSKVVGISVAVVKNNKIIYTHSFAKEY